jgi:phenylalanyl-tRNA synthetase beta chain
VRIVLDWLRDLVDVPGDPSSVAHAIALRGFEVATVEENPAVIDFEITANRPDCLNHLGLAREASAIWGLPLKMPELAMPAAGPAEAVDVTIESPELCPRYCAQVFEVRVGSSPDWLVKRLDAAGVRSINNVVDVTNYVMLELGQPMHAFDLEKLHDRHLIIRTARPGEKLRTLDGVERDVTPDILMIADAAGATAIAGVMGGRDSEVSATTRLIALESAYFQPAAVRRTSKRLGLKTEASTRFERGADINAPPTGVARAAVLLDRLGAGKPLGPLVDRYPIPGKPARVRLRAARIARVLGQEVPADQVPRFLEPLGFGVAPSVAGVEPGWMITVPTFRVDVQREVDLVEEVGRHYGFDRLPVTFPALRAPQKTPDVRIGRDRLIRRTLTACGFSESMTFAFIERQAAAPFAESGFEPVAIANPLSEKFAVLRPSLLPGLLDSCVHNRRRERRDVRLFETGSRFTASGEERAAAFAWCGAAVSAHWSSPGRAVDFYDARGVVDQLMKAFGVRVECLPGERAFLVAGRTGSIVTGTNGNRVEVAVVGQLRPDVAEARGFPPGEPIYAAEIALDAIAQLPPPPELQTETLPRFPSIVRDISILIDEALPAAAVRGTIRSSAPPTLISIAEFDRYQGKGVPEGRISLSLRLTFRAPDRTLTDEEVDTATGRIVDALAAQHRAERR